MEKIATLRLRGGAALTDNTPKLESNAARRVKTAGMGLAITDIVSRQLFRGEVSGLEGALFSGKKGALGGVLVPPIKNSAGRREVMAFSEVCETIISRAFSECEILGGREARIGRWFGMDGSCISV